MRGYGTYVTRMMTLKPLGRRTAYLLTLFWLRRLVWTDMGSMRKNLGLPSLSWTSGLAQSCVNLRELTAGATKIWFILFATYQRHLKGYDVDRFLALADRFGSPRNLLLVSRGLKSEKQMTAEVVDSARKMCQSDPIWLRIVTEISWRNAYPRWFLLSLVSAEIPWKVIFRPPLCCAISTQRWRMPNQLKGNSITMFLFQRTIGR